MRWPLITFFQCILDGTSGRSRMDDLKASRLAEAIQDSGIIFQVATVLGKKE